MGNSILKQRLEAPLAVEFIARPEPSEKHTAGISDAIFIWMIDKPGGDLFDHMQSLPDAALTHYLPLPLYWVDFGGTNNVTTRFRKNPGRHLIRQFTDRARLLDRNRSYSITIVQNNAIAEFWVDGECWIQTCDPNPLTSGYIGFRAFVADLTVRDLKIWRIESQ
jgi:rhamnogalacturonan endolyase